MIQYLAGSAFKGVVSYYPGVLPLRALVKHSEMEARAFNTPPGLNRVRQMALDFSTRLTQNPWLKSHPYLLTEVIPVKQQEGSGFRLIDRDREYISFTGIKELGGLEGFFLRGDGTIRCIWRMGWGAAVRFFCI